MSLSDAAEAMGIAEALVERSAEARAAEAGVSVDEILAGPGGGAMEFALAEVDSSTPLALAVADGVEVQVLFVDYGQAAAKSQSESCLALSTHFGVELKSVEIDPLAFRSGWSGLDGQVPWLSGFTPVRHAMLAFTPIQMVRPVVADVGLGVMTLNDTNQILGTRRFGPDLSDVGSRLGESEIGAIVGGAGEHPALSLAQEDLDDLVAYLSESAPGDGS